MRMKWWNEKCNNQFKYIFISDKNGLDRVTLEGPTEATLMKEYSEKCIEREKELFKDIQPIIYQAAPKPEVPSRVRHLMELFISNSIAIDRSCNHEYGVIPMINGMVSEKNKRGDVFTVDDELTPAKHCVNFKHIFDAMTYGMIAVHYGVVRVNNRAPDRGKIFLIG
jgi:hypothetical protein